MELVAFPSQRLGSGFHVRFLASPALSRVIKTNNSLAVTDALRHELLDFPRKFVILLCQELVFLLVPRDFLVALARALSCGGVLAHLGLHFARFVRQPFLHLLDVVLRSVSANARFVQRSFRFARLADVPLQLLLQRFELLGLEVHPALGFLGSASRGIRFALKRVVAPRAAPLQLLELLVHRVKLLIFLLNRGLKILRAHSLVLAA